MARGKKGVDGVDKVIELFPPGSHKMIERLLVRAMQREARAAGRNVKVALRGLPGGRSGRKLGGRLVSDLARALRQRGDVGGGKASIRQKAPGSEGGRPFHFAHSVVNKADAAPGAAGKAKAAPSGGGKARPHRQEGRAAAHMRYIEREIAVERLYGQGAEKEASLDGLGKDAVDRDGPWKTSDGRTPGEGARGLDGSPTPGLNQSYIENPTKLENGEQVVFSFGTIGDRFEDRVAFWEELEQAEKHPDARVQNRLIVELPHEASPEARFEMVRTFCRRFEEDGIPYWASLHAPGAKNDARNFHAHIVFTERPAKRMTDPATGRKVWDFSIVKHWTDSSRHARESRPHRQEKLRAYNARTFIPGLRKDFSDIVNEVLVREDVKDGSGSKVRYDARSYKAMGVDAVPMRSINRIVADKMRDGRLTILDGDYTKRMIAAELRGAAAKRHKGVLELIALDDVLRATAEAPNPRAMNAKLPRELRVSALAMPGKASLRKAGRAIMEARHAALHVDVMERSTTASLERIIAATEPKAVAATSKNRDPLQRAEAASSDGAALLHAAALEELAETRASAAKARRSIRYRVGAAVNAWREVAGVPPTETSPAIRAVLRDLEREDEEKRRPPAARRQAASDRGRKSGPEPDHPEPAAAEASVRPKGREAAAEAPRLARETIGRTDGRPGDQGSHRPARAEGIEGKGQTTARAGPPRAPTVPSTMEDALGIGKAPTNADLAAASSRMSSLIKHVMESSDDVEVRMRNIDAMMLGLENSVRARKGLPLVDKPSTGSCRADDQSRDVFEEMTSRGAGRAPAPTGDAPAGTVPEARNGGAPAAQAQARVEGPIPTPRAEIGRPDGGGRPTTDAGTPATGSSPSPSTTREGGATEQGARATPRSKTEDGVPVTTAKDTRPGQAGPAAKKNQPRDQVPQDPAPPAPEPEAEHPDTVRRRKEREVELEKRRRMRQAVLAKRNRGWSR